MPESSRSHPLFWRVGSLEKSMPRPNLLFLAHLLPWPLEGGGQIKSYHTLRALSERYDIKMIALVRSAQERDNVRYLEPFCRNGIDCYLLNRGKLRDLVHALRGALTKRSFLILRDKQFELDITLRIKHYQRFFDAVHVDHLQMAQYVSSRLPERNAAVVLDQHNVEHRIIQRIAENPGTNPLLRWYAGVEWPKLRDFEIAAMRRADVTLAVSDADRDAFCSLAPDLAGRVETVPIGVDTDYFAVAEREPDAQTILSIGTMSWLPNIDAVQWFVGEILPLLRAKRPGTRVCVVGSNPAKTVVALGKRDPGVVVTGTVPDVRPYAKECGVFVVPLRSGSGVRVKILNALAMGLPVVSTAVGAEGIAVTHGENILIADTPQSFADAVCRVLNDRALADHIGANGRALIERMYTWDAVGARLHAVYDRVLGTETTQ